MIQAVFFDLYETLITEWEDGKKKATYSIAELGIDKEVYKREWAARREKRMDGRFPDHKSVLVDILTSRGKKVDNQVIDVIVQRRVEAKLVPFKDVNDEILYMLKELKNRNIKLGLISNCTSEEIKGWSTSPLPEFFDDVVFSFEVGKSKPNLGIYQLACKNLHVSPENSLFIGDGGSNELYGASEAGMKAFHATWFLPPEISERTVGYPKLNDPNQIIEIVNMKNIKP